MTGSLVSIHVSPARGIPMREVDMASLVAGHGIEGDRYRNSRHRHVSVQAEEALAEASEALGTPIPAGATRRNLTVRGVEIPTRPGARMRVGEAELEVVRIAAPCTLLDDWIAPGAKTALRRRAGTIFRVLNDATIAIDDRVEPLAEA